ncbi:MAG: ketopantoate reductase family protein [Cellvibrionales bacterium]|nr:ketopantoate reductase family protein [Cellvibrionales bacterium]
MRVVIHGAGGLGSVLGGRLALAGVEVTLIARPAHVQAIEEHGLRLTGIRGEAHITKNLTAVSHPDQAQGDFDYYLIGVKGKDTQATLRDAANLLPRCAAFASLQNSLTKEEILAQNLPADRTADIFGFITTEGGYLVEPGLADNHSTLDHSIYIGELSGGTSERVDKLIAAFNQGGIGAHAAADIRHVAWEKIAQVASYAGWSIMALGPFHNLGINQALSLPELARSFVLFARDLLSVYQAKGYEVQNFFAPITRLKEIVSLPLDEAVALHVEMGRKQLQKSNAIVRCSMHDDILRHKHCEVEEQLGPFYRGAREHNLNTPHLDAAYQAISGYNAIMASGLLERED